MKQKKILTIIFVLIIGVIVGFLLKAKMSDSVVSNSAAVIGSSSSMIKMTINSDAVTATGKSLSVEGARVTGIIKSTLKAPVTKNVLQPYSQEIGAALKTLLAPVVSNGGTGGNEIHIWMFDCGGGEYLTITLDDFGTWSHWWASGPNTHPFGNCVEIWNNN